MILLFSVNCSKKKPGGLGLGVLALAGSGGGGSSSSSSSGDDNKTKTVKPTDPKEPSAKSKEALITAFSIGSDKGTIANQNIKVTVPYGTDVTALTATTKISDKAKISPDPSQVMDYTNPVNFTVTAEDGTTKKVYKVTVTVEGPISSWIGGWKVSDKSFSATITDRTITIDVDSANFTTTVTFLPSGAKLQPDPNLVTDWSSTVNFTVTVGSKEDIYNVKVQVDGKDIIKAADLNNLKTIMNAEIVRHGNTADYNYIDVSDVTSMNSLFSSKRNFNGDITKWDTSQVTDMQEMFDNANAFNQDIGFWDIDQVTSCTNFSLNSALDNANKPPFVDRNLDGNPDCD